MNNERPKIFTLLISCLFIFAGETFANEKSTLSVNSNCGDISEGEFMVSQELHTYKINMQPGDILDANIIPVGAYLQLDAELYDPVDQKLEGIMASSAGTKLIMKSKVLSGRGEYKVQVRNYNKRRGNSGRAGMYEIHFGCVKRNGDNIIPSGK